MRTRTSGASLSRRRQEGPDDRDRRLQRLHPAERGAGARRNRRQRLPAPALSRQPDQDAGLSHRSRSATPASGRSASIPRSTKVADLPRRRGHRRAERSVQRRPCAARAAERGRDQAEGRHRHSGDHRRHRREPQEGRESRSSTQASSAARSRISTLPWSTPTGR